MTVHEYVIRKDTGGPVRDNCAAFIASLDASKSWRVTVQPFRKKRSLAQNRLNWLYCNAVAEAVSDYTGMDAEAIHQFMKAKFAPPKALEMNGQWVDVRSTTMLNTAEMSKYCDDIYRFCVEEIGLILPTPGLYEECGGDMGLLRERITQPAKEN